MIEMIKDLIREEIQRAATRQYFFMAGLPRSGSTLLSSILNQNPKVHSGPSSPVVPIMLTLESSISNDELFRAYPKVPQAAKIISSVLENYYSDVNKPIIIDKNRSWVNRIHYIPGYFGIENPKILCPVRNIDEILASFLKLRNKNPFSKVGKINFIDEMLIKNNINLTDENRCEMLTGPNGILGQSYLGIKQALLKGNQKFIHFVEYTDLINDPANTMKKIYEFLGLENFEHNFENVENQHKEFDDEVYGLTDMHEVRKKVEKTSVDPRDILPESILEKCKNVEFWRNLEEYTDSTDKQTVETPEYTETYNNMLEETNIIGN